MPHILLHELPRVDAERFCAAVAEREPSRLAELSSWIQVTGGPWDELDASVDSLLPLWEWFIRFVDDGCPGIPDSAFPQTFYRDPATPQAGSGAVGYAAEAIGHYLMLVVRRLDPEARWEPYIGDGPQVNFHRYQQPWIRLSDGSGVMPQIFVASMATSARAARERPEHRDHTLRNPGALREKVVLWLSGHVPAAQEPAGPALPSAQSTPDPPRTWWTPPSASPVPAPRQGPTPADHGPTSVETIELGILNGHESDLEADRMHRLEPLDRRLIETTLHSFGFLRDDDEEDDEEGGDPEIEAWYLAEPGAGTDLELEAELYRVDDTIRYVRFSGHTRPGAPPWPHIHTHIGALAHALGAKLLDHRVR